MFLLVVLTCPPPADDRHAGHLPAQSAVNGLRQRKREGEERKKGLSNADGELVMKGKPRPVRTLHTLMQENGHAWIDLMKKDIDYGEWKVLDAMIAQGRRMPLTQAQIEFHVVRPQAAIETMAGLQALGMQAFHVEENNNCTTCYNRTARGKFYEVSFANTHKDGSLVLGPR
jgi:hypothetical protein